MMNMLRLYIVLCVMFIMNSFIHACPFTITNDTEKQLFITAQNGRAIRLKPDTSKVIDPTVMGGWLWKWFMSEKLYVYLETEESDRFYQAYELREKYCSDIPEENQFTISEVFSMNENLVKRFDVTKLERPPKEEHDHVHKH